MYEYISGKIDELTPANVVIDAGGVGYYIIISLNTYSALEGRDHAKVYIHYTVREDAQIFFGFATKQEREIFRLLLSVSGVGGSTARMVLSTYTPSELTSIISSGNATLLKNVKGLGIKTAQKIIVEVRDKIIGVTGDASLPNVAPGKDDGTYQEALAALTMLGFPKAASEKALGAILKENPAASVEDIIRLSLKKL